MFDRVLTIDWSGRSKPSPVATCADAIFTCFGDQHGVAHPVYHRTRHAVMDYIGTVVDTAKQQKGTTLIGFDFSFGYPHGFAQHLTGSLILCWIASFFPGQNTPLNVIDVFETQFSHDFQSLS